MKKETGQMKLKRFQDILTIIANQTHPRCKTGSIPDCTSLSCHERVKEHFARNRHDI